MPVAYHGTFADHVVTIFGKLRIIYRVGALPKLPCEVVIILLTFISGTLCSCGSTKMSWKVGPDIAVLGTFRAIREDLTGDASCCCCCLVTWSSTSANPLLPRYQ